MAIRWAEGILIRDGKVLIAKLRNKNPFIVRLEWSFPFTEIKEDESPRLAIKRLFQEELGFKSVNVGKFLVKFVPSENPKIEQYFYEIRKGSGNVISSKNFSEFKWVNPTQVLSYFTTSISKEIMDYLRFLEKEGKGIIIF